ncbi:hypothetical protein L596_018814 [Steinernema carpocapsae]|uniref:Acyl-CoA-binding domain-containing protein 6 n=1 Tax=Steinernema carpocapsae TaxID=34508 RepID=A0A4V6A264_STECR|nr:hypothetical protein L596_018814 [Steinernema carpocapsae]
MFVVSLAKYLSGRDSPDRVEKPKAEPEFDEFGDPIGYPEVDASTEALFNSACSFLETATDRISREDLMFFYAHYKQAMNGPADPNTRPNIFEQIARRKYDAWRALKDLGRADAMRAYVAKLASLGLEWDATQRESSATLEGGPLGSGFSVRMSRPARNVSESEPTADTHSLEERWFHAVRAGRTVTLKHLLESNLELINHHEDETLLTALHWGADTGNVGVCMYLLENGAEIDAIEVDGQTSLHYAVVCANKEIVELLLRNGADPHLKDKDGLSALDFAEDDEICEIIEAAVRKTDEDNVS